MFASLTYHGRWIPFVSLLPLQIKRRSCLPLTYITVWTFLPVRLQNHVKLLIIFFRICWREREESVWLGLHYEFWMNILIKQRFNCVCTSITQQWQSCDILIFFELNQRLKMKYTLYLSTPTGVVARDFGKSLWFWTSGKLMAWCQTTRHLIGKIWIGMISDLSVTNRKFYVW